jgi:hypothetical protein
MINIKLIGEDMEGSSCGIMQDTVTAVGWME